MFTGLIQGLGYLQPQGPQQILVKCGAVPFWEDLAIGDSVAVDGVCLTVETLIAQGFVVSVSPETVQRTTLSQRLQTHQAVNLEPALSVGDRLGAILSRVILMMWGYSKDYSKPIPPGS